MTRVVDSVMDWAFAVAWMVLALSITVATMYMIYAAVAGGSRCA